MSEEVQEVISTGRILKHAKSSIVLSVPLVGLRTCQLDKRSKSALGLAEIWVVHQIMLVPCDQFVGGGVVMSP